MIYEDKGLQVENGRIAPPPTPEQEVPEEIEKIVQELRNLEQAAEKIQEHQTENSRTAGSTEQPVDLKKLIQKILLNLIILILTCCYWKL